MFIKKAATTNGVKKKEYCYLNLVKRVHKRKGSRQHLVLNPGNLPIEALISKKCTMLAIFLIIGLTPLMSQPPAWLKTRPVSDEYFYGRGEGGSADAAELAGIREIQLQLKAQVNAAIQIASHSGAGDWEIYKKMNTFFNTPRLRNATVEDRYRSGGTHHALVRYPEDCGLQLARLAVKRYEDEHNVNPEPS